VPKSKTQVKKGLDRLMNAPGTSDDIWDDLLGASDPRKRFVRSLGGARKYDDRAAVLVFQAMVEAHLQLALVKIMKILRVGEDVSIPTPHSPGRADFQHPVLHGRALLMAV
jgi:hypothetical protein